MFRAVPVSHFGLSTGRGSLGSEILIAMKCFCDGSIGESDSGDEWITLAGFAAPDAAWSTFDDLWIRMLRERYPIAPYVHMIELLDSEDPFDRVNGWDFSKIHALVTDSLSVMGQMDKNQFQSVSCCFNKSASDRMSNKGRESIAFSACAKLCASMALGWHDTAYITARSLTREPGYFFFDRNEKFVKRMKKEWLASRTEPGKPKVTGNVWDRFENMIEDDMKNRPGLQAADMLAWATTRRLSDRERAFSSLKYQIRECVNSTEISISEGVMLGTEPLVMFNNGSPIEVGKIPFMH